MYILLFSILNNVPLPLSLLIVGKGLLDEVSKEVAGKINYDGLLISTSLLDKGIHK